MFDGVDGYVGGVRYTLYSTVDLFINESPYVCETCVFSNIGETVN